jgi:ribonuclease BN (tRNA processing enzyme)
MRLTVVGSGDAFGSGGRFNTCFFLETAKANVLVDFGASSPVAMKVRGIDHGRVDAIILSHLHGDHFCGLPFLLLDAQHLSRRTRPLVIAGPPGTRTRLDQAMEVMFPRSSGTKWRFPWHVVEIEPGTPSDVVGLTVTSTEVVHQSGAPSTALRLSDGASLFAYSGDTEWTEALISVADGAALFICECYGYAGRMTGHMSWEILKSRLPDLRAERIMLTHMNPDVLARVEEIASSGVLIAEDGKVLEF